MSNQISIIKLFWIFFKISCVLFGGGYAILPFLKAELVEKEKICTVEEIADYYALSQCFPGLVAGNISVLLGYKARGFMGAFACLVGVCLPAYLVIILVYSSLNAIMGNAYIDAIFQVLDIAVCVLIVLTIIELWSRSVFDKFTLFIFISALICSLFGLSPFSIIICSALLGVVKYLLDIKINSQGGASE